MKHTLLFLATTAGLTPLCGLAQNPVPPPPPAQVVPPVPPAPPGAPSVPPAHPRRNLADVFLGVEAAPLPAALSDQLNLPEGFGLLVDYVVPGSAADAAGVKTHDILKMLNDQILTSEEQLSTLVRSFSEGQAVTLLVLRKGQETKLAATLQKRQARTSDRLGGRGPREHRDGGSSDSRSSFHFDLNLDDLANPELADRIRESVDRSREQVEAATERAKDEMKRATEIMREHNARATGSRVETDDAHILLRDATGRLEIRSSHGKRTLTVRDVDDKKVFEGPIDTPEQREAIPAEVLPKVEALERDQAVTFPKRQKARDEDDDGNNG